MNTATIEKELKKAKVTDAELNATLISERRRLGLKSLFFHDKHILGYEDMTERTHLPMCNFVSDWSSGRQGKLFIAPRDCFKSSLNTIGQTTWLIAKNPLVKILIVSEIEDNAKKYLSEIQMHLSKPIFQETYSYLFDDYTLNAFNSECINFAPRNSNVNSTGEHTVDIAGIGTPKVGKHYDYIFFVDPHSERNIGTREQIEKVITYYRLMDMIRKTKTGRMIVEMTRWDHYDVAEHILNKEKGLVDVMIKSCYNEDGSLFFPERLSEEILADKRQKLGTHLFACHYLSKPQSDEDKPFKPEIATYYDALPDGLRKVCFADPSISEKESADDFALLGLGINRTNNAMHSIGWERVNRKMPAQAVGSIIAFLRTYFNDQPAWEVAIETLSYQRIYKFELERELGKQGRPFIIHELKPSGRAKKARIMGLQPFYQCGKMLFRRGPIDGPSPDLELLLQFERFPRGVGKDDFIDTWAYALDILQPKRDPVPGQTTIQSHFARQVLAARSGKQNGLRRRFK